MTEWRERLRLPRTVPKALAQGGEGQNGVLDGTNAYVTDSNIGTMVKTGGGASMHWNYPAYVDGLIDELRISNVARDANWIAAAYNTMSRPSCITHSVWREMHRAGDPGTTPPTASR